MANGFHLAEQLEYGVYHATKFDHWMHVVRSCSGGFWTGVREGWNLALMENSFSIGASALPRLAAVRSGSASELNRAVEFDVDSGLIWSHHFLDSPLSGFLAPVWGIGASARNPQSIMRLANYRKTYPSPTKADVFDDVIPRTATRREDNQGSTGIEERLAIISDMVKRYASSQ